MGRFSRFLMIVIAMGVFSVFALAVRADIAEPGSENDPLVTKSYVDRVLTDIKDYVDSKTGGSGGLEVVYLEKGEKIIGDGGTEIVLRSGQAAVVDSIGGGISDLTAGKDLKKGERALQNHLLLIPRKDGRGLVAQTDVVLMVRGNFTVVK
ncbi:MAG TPA: hypothetical protein GXX35_13945 [Thermoanaerobacterales bacterium]|nr:hypothetical protein [Thermoanaerobacterales bacterium]